MNPTEEQAAQIRAQLLQKKLHENGIIGINFTFAPGVEQQKPAKIMQEVCDFLDTYLEGRYKPLDRIDETPLEEVMLADFYGATNKLELIQAQARHIRRLELKIQTQNPRYTPGLELVEEIK